MNRITIAGVEYSSSGDIRIDQVGRTIIYNGSPIGNEFQGIVEIKVLEGSIHTLNSSANVVCQDVTGNVDASGNVVAKNIGGNVDASGNVVADLISKSVDAGGNVAAKNIGGSVKAGGNVRYG